MARVEPGVLEERAARLRELLENDPSDATAWFGLGRALFDLDRAGEAVAAFRSATERDPDYTAAYRDLGRALLASGEAEEAARVLRAGLPIAERHGDLQTGREMEVFLRRAESARGAGSSAKQTDPAAASATTGRPPESVDPTAVARARALYKEGFDHFASDRIDDAIARYEEAIALHPQLAIAWNGLSLAHRQRGDLDAAIETGRRLIELEPDDPLSHTNLSILYMRKGLVPEAEEEKGIAMQLQMRAERR